jgi:radical SAM protein with 4Fe4S-binding SPASM domain
VIRLSTALLSHQHWRLHVPDYREERHDTTLLIWGAAPHWTVVDRDLATFLALLDGTRTLDEILAAHPDWEQHRAALGVQIENLHKVGVLSGEGPWARPVRLPGPPKPRIENVALNLTLHCNLHCAFCYNREALNRPGVRELTASEVLHFLRTLRPLLAKHPTLTVLGGEPLLAADVLLAVAPAARDLGFTVLVSTNGALIDASFARAAAAAGIRMQVSLDGPTARVHDAGRGVGVFDRAVSGVRALVDAGVHTTVSMVCHADNVATLGDFLELAGTLGVQEARFIPLKRLGGGLHAVTPVPLADLLRTAVTVLTRHPEYLPLLGTDALSVLAFTCRYALRRPSCGTGLQTLLLDADGALYPCANLTDPAFRIGNIRDPDFRFARLWASAPALVDVRHQSAIAASDGPHAHCPVRYWCLGGCRGENHALSGTIAAAPPHCAELRRGMIEMLWILAEHPELVGHPSPTC